MSLKITTTFLILGLSQLTNASFFGLFSSPQPTRKPDAVVSESQKSETDKNAYQNYLQSLASSFYASANPPARFVPVYSYQPQYASYIQPQHRFIYPASTVPRILKAAPSLQYNYQPLNVKTSSVKLPSASGYFARPITVLPSSSYDATYVGGQVAGNNLNERIDESPSAGISREANNVKTLEFEIPEARISASLYDLPVSGISPDFHTGGYVTKMMTVGSSDSNTRSGRKFGHQYSNGDGTKVSEEGQLVSNGKGQETVLKRGKYEYIDANGKSVLVKWVADDNGFRLVN